MYCRKCGKWIDYDAGKVKPIPALVPGIVSIVLSGLSLFISFISLTSVL